MKNKGHKYRCRPNKTALLLSNSFRGHCPGHCFLRQCCSSLLAPILGKKLLHLLILPRNLHQSESCFLRLLHPFCLLLANTNCFFVFCFYLFMFWLYRNGIRNHVRLDKKATLQCRA